MAEGGVVSTKSRIDCSICLETFKEPKLLPCYHTFCVICLEKYIEKSGSGGTFECPLCRKVIAIPHEGVASFQTNFYIELEDKFQEESVTCEACDESVQADHHCLDCEQNFCSRCAGSHMKMKVSQSHRLKELKTADRNIKCRIKARTFCPKHQQKEIEVVCKQCDQLLCVLCMLTDHQGHRSREVTEEAREVREKLGTTVEDKSIVDTLRRQTKAISDMQEMKVNLKTSRNGEVKIIRDQGAKLHQVVDKNVTLMEKELLAVYDASLNAYEKQIKSSDTFSLSLKSLVMTARQVVDQATDVEIIEKGNALQKQLQAEISKDPTRQTEENKQQAVVFCPAGEVDVCSLKKMIGTIQRKQTKENEDDTRLSVTPAKEMLSKVGSLVAGGGSYDVYGIAPISNNRAWVCFSTNKLEQIDSSGHCVVSLNVGSRVNAVASDENDNCIISCPEDKSIKRVTTKGTIETIVAKTKGTPHNVVYRRRSNGTGEVMFVVYSFFLYHIYVAPNKVGATFKIWGSDIFGSGFAADSANKKVCFIRYGTAIISDENGQVLSEVEASINPFSVCFDTQGRIIMTENSASSPFRRMKPGCTKIDTLTNITGRVVAIDSQSRLWVGKNKGVIDIYDLK